MNRVHTMAFRLLVGSLLLWSCFNGKMQAQTPSRLRSQRRQQTLNPIRRKRNRTRLRLSRRRRFPPE